MVNPRCFMDISIGGEMEGRMVFELYRDVVPKTVENFRALCTGEKGVSPITGVPLHYKGTRFNQVIRGYMIQAGNISAGNEMPGESIYGPTFEDENFDLKHSRKGMVSMASLGPNTNGSQFFIIPTQAAHLDGKNVVFGKVIKGLGLIRTIELVETKEDNTPAVDVVIEDCGEIPEGVDDGTLNFFMDGDMYPDWPLDLDTKPESASWLISAMESIKALGNEWFKKQDYKMAARKYRKAIKYLDLGWEMDDIDKEKGDYMRRAKSQILANSSVCKLKLGDLGGALLDADFAIRDGEDNAKAYYRQGQVYMALNNIHAAAESFGKALELEPNDSGIKRELAVVKKKIAEKREQEKKAYSKMFG